jgi:hypothetical protein
MSIMVAPFLALSRVSGRGRGLRKGAQKKSPVADPAAGLFEFRDRKP